MDSLSDKTSVKMVMKALDALPKGSKALDMAYDGAMQRVDSQLEGYRHLAKQLLSWLTYSERLMSVEEIQHALAIEPGESSMDEDNLSDIAEIVGCCAGLVIVEEDTRSLRLVHYTTREYFRQNGDKTLVTAQRDIAISCLTYLLYEEFGTGWVYKTGQVGNPLSLRLQKHPFLEYAARHWTSHASKCDEPIVKELTMSFVNNDRKVSCGGQVILSKAKGRLYEIINDTLSPSRLTAMQVLAYGGHKEMVSELLSRGFGADVQDDSRGTPLWWAVKGDHYAMVECLLLENHGNVNSCAFSDRTVIRLGSSTGTPLHEAVNRKNTLIVKALLNRADIDVNSLDMSGRTALDNAVYYNCTSIVKLLLGCAGIDLTSRDKLGYTPLHEAATWGFFSIVKLLLDCTDINVNSPDMSGRTALYIAVYYNSTPTVELLLNCANIDVHSPDRLGDTPLHVAATHGHVSILKLFCAHPKVILDSRDSKGRNIVSLVKQQQERMSRFRRKEGYDERMVELQECLDIIRTAIEERKSGNTAQLAEQSSQT